jgi:hypothetical protein
MKPIYELRLWYYDNAPDDLKAQFKERGELILWAYNGNGVVVDMNTPDPRYWFTLFPDHVRVDVDEQTSVYLLKSKL